MSQNPIFIKTDINNGALNSINAMPQKDGTSDGTSTFELGRSVYLATHATNNPPMCQNNQKKWMGNRDSSQVTANRRNSGIGKSSINTSTQNVISFTTYKDVNVVNDALRRCRAGGAVAPPKASHRPNGLTPTFRPAVPPNNNYYGTKYPTLFH